MSNQLQVFNNPKFGQVRTVTINNKTYFVAVDIAKALGYARPNDAINQHCRWAVKHRIPHPQSPEKLLEVNVIPEGDIYRLAAKSELPGADEFESWIFDEVIPQIRKTGGYIANDDLFINTYLPFADDTVKSLFKATLQTVRQQNEKIKELTPKAQSFDVFIDGSNLQTMNDVAKCLGIGRNKLFALLREKKIIRSNNTPYQEYIDRGYFEVKEKPIKMGDASINYAQTYVTAKGVAYISKVIVKSA